MAVETQVFKVGPLVGNGASTLFSFSPMVIFESSNLVVTLIVNATGVETTLSEGTGANAYSVAASTTFPGTGSITYPEDTVSPITSASSIIIKRVLTVEQLTDLENQGGYFPEVLEEQLDKNVMLTGQQQESIDRSLKFPIGDLGTIPTTTGTTVGAATKYLRVSAAADALEWAAIATTGATASDLSPVNVSGAAASAGTGADFSREDHVHDLSNVAIADGGTGATTAAAARTNLGTIATIVEDTTPQLGGDLDLNSKNIDFPTTANISDCLDEDTMSTNSATMLATQQSIKAYVDADSIIQRVLASDATLATGNTALPDDDTIPQNDEGAEFITVTITPINSSSRLRIEGVLHFSSITDPTLFSLALFQDSTVGALAAWRAGGGASGILQIIPIFHEMAAGTTSATTFKIRAGTGGGATCTFNGQSGARKFGGALISQLTITEIQA